MLNNFSRNMLTNAMILNISKRLNRMSSDETQDDDIYIILIKIKVSLLTINQRL